MYYKDIYYVGITVQAVDPGEPSALRSALAEPERSAEDRSVDDHETRRSGTLLPTGPDAGVTIAR